MFDQVNLCPPSIFVFDVTSSLPVVSDNVIYKEVTKGDSKLPIMIGCNAQYGIVWAVDLCHNNLGVFMMFNSNKPHVNNINNIHMY